MAETINGLYKAEVIWRQRSWRSASAVEMATLRWVDWPNNRRHFGPIGHFPPAEPEANCYLVMIGELLGHAIIGTSQRHAHLDDATLLEASDTIGLAINTWMREVPKCPASLAWSGGTAVRLDMYEPAGAGLGV